jgi:hypothetical protein
MKSRFSSGTGKLPQEALMNNAVISDPTVDELRNLIREVVAQTLLELLGDPDEGLELREEIQDRLHRSLAATPVESTSAQAVAAKLGLEW